MMQKFFSIGIFLAISLSGFVVGQDAVNNKKNRQLSELQDKIETQLDVEYAKAGDISLKLDIFKPKSGGDHAKPCIVWIHGGGWQKGDKSSGMQRLGKWIAEGEYVGASVGYRLTDKGSWPAQIHDCKAAIRYLRANAKSLGIQPDRIGVWGGSAGGHLVSMLGTSGDIADLEGSLGVTGVSSRVNCVVDYCGPSDFLRFSPDSPKLNKPGESVYKLLGGPIGEKMEIAKQASPASYISKDDPPFLIVHGTLDPLVPIDQATSFHQRQLDAGMKTTFIKLEGAGHGLAGEELDRRVKAFFDRELLGRNVTVSDEVIVVKSK